MFLHICESNTGTYFYRSTKFCRPRGRSLPPSIILSPAFLLLAIPSMTPFLGLGVYTFPQALLCIFDCRLLFFRLLFDYFQLYSFYISCFYYTINISIGHSTPWCRQKVCPLRLRLTFEIHQLPFLLRSLRIEFFLLPFLFSYKLWICLFSLSDRLLDRCSLRKIF